MPPAGYERKHRRQRGLVRIAESKVHELGREKRIGGDAPPK